MTNIVVAPSSVLRQVAKPVMALDKRVQDVVNDIEKVLLMAKDPQGVGLAAPQIGVSLRIFMIRPTKNGPITTLVNPEITKFSQRKNKPTSKHGVYEGCLSIPNHYSPITRSMSVTVKYQTPSTTPLPPPKIGGGGPPLRDGGGMIEKTEVFSGFAAHVIQHELDHLNGILFIDRVLEQNTALYRIEGDEWVEISL